MAEVLPPRKKFGANLQPQTGRDVAPKDGEDKDIWLVRAKEAFDTSTSFIETNYRKDWNNSIRHFQNRHMEGSKYYSETYKYRSKSFRPKTRSTVRGAEAATASAFFSQMDVITIDPEDDKDPLQLAGTDLRQELMNYRLSAKRQIPWFQICVGAMQEAEVMGLVCSKQFWDFREKEVEISLSIDGESVLTENGEPATAKQMTTVRDQPDIKLYPLENIRFDPAAEWTDVVNTSPYFIAMDPMRIGDVKAKITSGEWNKVDDTMLMSARNNYYDSTRQTRQDKKEDDKDPRYTKALSEFDMVWVHENFMRIAEEEWQYYTLGTLAILTEKKPLEKAYLHGVRPFVVGTNMIEPHRSVPDSAVHISKHLQKDANEVNNTRRDNVLLVLNKRWKVKRGSQVDLQSLVRNAPGSVSLMNNMDDAEPVEFNDVTGSSFAEQDRVNMDMDELNGSFSTGSVATNRKLGETVGGMQMLRGTANSMGQYLIRVFSETWVERVLNQLDELEQFYESDMALLATMAKRANLEKYGIEAIDKSILMAPGRVKVNIANSAQDPTVRLELFLFAMAKYAEFRSTMPPDIDPEPVKQHIFGLLGLRDASRFSVDVEGNPQLQEMQQQIQQLEQALNDKMAEIEAKNQVGFAKIQEDNATKRLDMVMKRETEADKLATNTLIAEMNNATKVLVEQMDEDNQNAINTSSDKTKAALGALEKRTNEIMSTISDSSTGDAIKEAVTQMTIGFKAVADANDKGKGSMTEVINALKSSQDTMTALAKSINAPRESKITERDAEGVPTRARSSVVK